MSSFDDYIGTFDAEPGYLNWAAFGPVSPSVRAEVFADADLLGSGRPSSLALVGERIGQAQEVIAELLGADPRRSRCSRRRRTASCTRSTGSPARSSRARRSSRV
ncbi:hypothetical protein OYT00_15750 [Microbacterium paraoxydans]|uniref:hypothetical protein n=1 Tax=Microbacterium paraoxydans TaxID=199592 RepID=UPI00228591F6|nr:hypothetical protein [Microbacterium paraoxydans]MCZ0711460.1 hypothetical protein [Microbacterium paraoxydans]